MMRLALSDVIENDTSQTIPIIASRLLHKQQMRVKNAVEASQ
jgi:hypothetical protein